jgi:hypothetical protein
MRRARFILFSGRMTMVKCEICGCTFNEKFLASHKRLSHRRKTKTSPEPTTDPEIAETILSLFDRLSKDSRRDIVKRLAAIEH